MGFEELSGLKPKMRTGLKVAGGGGPELELYVQLKPKCVSSRKGATDDWMNADAMMLQEDSTVPYDWKNSLQCCLECVENPCH